MSSALGQEVRIAGALLTLSIVIPAAVFVVFAARGEMGGSGASFRGVEGITEPPGAGLRWGRWVFVPALITMLVGFNLLTIQLQAMGDRTLSSLALTLFVFMAVLHILEQAFHGTVTLWAVEQAAQGQSIPSLYEQLRRWITPAIQHVYMLAVMLAMTL